MIVRWGEMLCQEELDLLESFMKLFATQVRAVSEFTKRCGGFVFVYVRDH